MFRNNVFFFFFSQIGTALSLRLDVLSLSETQVYGNCTCSFYSPSGGFQLSTKLGCLAKHVLES